MSASRLTLSALALAGVTACSLQGGLTTFTDLTEWTTATSGVTTIEFSDLPAGTFVTDQYAPLGVTFTPGDDQIDFLPSIYPSDGYGLFGGYNGLAVPLPIIMEFSTPITSIGIRFPGSTKFELYSNGIKIGVTQNFFAIGDPTSFAGVISDIAFDRVVIPPVLGNVSMDTLFFGGAIPGPGALAVLLGGAVALRGRRRRG